MARALWEECACPYHFGQLREFGIAFPAAMEIDVGANRRGRSQNLSKHKALPAGDPGRKLSNDVLMQGHQSFKFTAFVVDSQKTTRRIGNDRNSTVEAFGNSFVRVNLGQQGKDGSRLSVTLSAGEDPETGEETISGKWELGERNGPVTISGLGLSLDRVIFYSNDRKQETISISEIRADRPAEIGFVQRTPPLTCGSGNFRGNCPRFHVDIFGKNLIGQDPLWVDPAQRLEVENKWICGNGDHLSEWYLCEDLGGVSGIRATVIIRNGAKPGKRTLWVNGIPVEFEFVLATRKFVIDAESLTFAGGFRKAVINANPLKFKGEFPVVGINTLPLVFKDAYAPVSINVGELSFKGKYSPVRISTPPIGFADGFAPRTINTGTLNVNISKDKMSP